MPGKQPPACPFIHMHRIPHSRPFVLLALALIFLIGTGMTAGAASAGDLVRVSGASPYADCTAGGVSGSPATNVNYPNGEVEPYAAVNPGTIGSGHVDIVGVWQQDRWSTGAARGIVAGYSFDGGRTWESTPLPFDVCASGPADFNRASDPWISFGPNGRAYAAALVTGPNRVGVEVVVSRDGGKTWSKPRDVIVDNSRQRFDDKESISADPARPGTVYAVWDRFKQRNDAPQPAMFSKSSDGGKTWSAARAIVPATQANTGTVGNQIVVDPHRGTLYDIFMDAIERQVYRSVCRTSGGHTTCRKVRVASVKPQHQNQVSFVESTDAGVTWSKPRTIARDLSRGVPRSLGGPFRTGGGLPEAAIDVNGHLYVTWDDARFSGQHYDEIALSTSSDGGLHWSAPVRVNAPTGHPAFTPSIVIDTDGVVGMTYYALRGSPSSGGTVPTDYWFTDSTDGGRHFGREIHIAGPFDFRSAPFAGGYFLGDYEGLAAVGSGFEPFFVMTNSRDRANPTDVFSTRVTP